MERGRDYCASHPFGLRLGGIPRVGVVCDKMAKAGADLPVDFPFQQDVRGNAFVCFIVIPFVDLLTLQDDFHGRRSIQCTHRQLAAAIPGAGRQDGLRRRHLVAPLHRGIARVLGHLQYCGFES